MSQRIPSGAPRATRYHAQWVLPVSGPPIHDGAVLVADDGRIAAVGPAVAVPRPDAAATVELGAALLMPGLVNTHAHPELGLFRGLIEDRPFHRWIRGLLRVKRTVPDLDYALSADWAVAESLAAGITTLAATEDSGAALDALRRAGARGIVYREAFGPAPEQADEAVAELRRKVDDMRGRATELVGVGVSPHAPYTVSDDLYRGVAELARAEALPLALHLAESEAESLLVAEGRGPFAEGLRRRGMDTAPRGRTPVDLVDRLGLLGERTLLIHCVRVDARDVARIADTGTSVAHCPVANARLGHGAAPLDELLRAGVRVGLGTDSVGSNNRQDLLEEARTAQLIQRARLNDPELLDGERLLRLSTLDAAGALGLDSRVGSLDPGKDADLCAIALDAPHVAPVHDPHAALFMAARGSDVILTVVRGRVLYRRGAQPEWLTLDAAALRDRVNAEARRVRDTLAAAARAAGQSGP